MQMIRLARNAEFREAAGRVASELQKAGIKIDSQVGFLCLRTTSSIDLIRPAGGPGRAHAAEERNVG
jgi:hypothetical protein